VCKKEDFKKVQKIPNEEIIADIDTKNITYYVRNG